MKLRVTAGKRSNTDVHTYEITINEFTDRAYHYFIATTEWTQIDLDLTEEFPRGMIKQLFHVCSKIIPHFDLDNVTKHIVGLLCEIVPDDAIQLRLAFVNGSKEFTSVLEKVSLKYGW